MAHFAELDANNNVLNVVVVDNALLIDENGEEQESLGLSYLASIMPGKVFKQCSYNAARNHETPSGFRGKYPDLSLSFWKYDPEIDQFYNPYEIPYDPNPKVV